MRFESKYSLNPINDNQFLSWLHTSRLGFKRCYDDRQVNSLYYDSFNCKALNDNIDGIADRSKVRLRWYGESKLPRFHNLEIKHKRNSLGFKSVFKFDELADFKNHNSLFRLLCEQLPEQYKNYLLSCSYPQSIVRYNRAYFLTICKKIRITIDDNINYSRQHSKNFDLKPLYPLNRNKIIEIKYDQEHKEYLASNLSNFPLRITKNSKYVNSFTI